METKFGGFWARFAATLVDSLWLVPLTWGPIVVVAWNRLMDPDGTPYLWLYLFCQFALPCILYVFLWYRFQSSPGKMALGLKVVDSKTLERASIGKYFLRYVGYFLSMLTLLLGYFWVGIDKRKRGLHDYVGGTVVIYRPKAPGHADSRVETD